MTMRLILRLLAATLAGLSPVAAKAQAMVQALPGTTDADALAAAMRRVAANPVDLSALLDAGDLSLRVDDISAAASFFARADKVDPRNGRVKAGMGSILVRAERPGEALRYFQEAEQLGLAPVTFAADRGYAYDLTGDQPRARRDYTLVLAARPDDAEVIRRYALSLGIAGRKDAALAAIEPLTRRQDRGAWRARAFILAMNGDLSQANQIATTMMPGGTAQGLAPFFARLPGLGPVDRAFAVHFGEVRPTPERLADARLAPVLPPLPPEAQPAPVQVAMVVPDTRRDRRHGRDKRLAPAVQVAQQNQSTPTASAPAAPPHIAAAAPAGQSRPIAPPVVSVSVPPMVAANEGSYRLPSVVTARPTASPPLPAAPLTGQAIATRAPLAVTLAAPVTATPTPPAVAPASRASAPVMATTANSVAPLAVPPGSVPISAAPLEIAPPPGARLATPMAMVQPLPAAPAPVPPPTPRAHDEAAIARIIAGLSIPASELGVVPLPHRQAAAAVSDATVDAARERAAHDAAEKQAALDKLAAAKAAAEKKAADRKAAKALADKKAAAATKAEEAREAAEQRKLERANPTRIWVQVAGGAHEDDLGKAWKAAKAKAPEVFAGHSGYTTPLRATNRVVTGPFKTEADARAFVNSLAKKGVSAFTFTSDAGQKIAKLPGK